MLYKFTSVDEVIGRVIRNTRLQDTSYIGDMPEWIAEAMSFMRTRTSLVSDWKDIALNFHVGELPCALTSIKGVEYAGTRLRILNSLRSYGHPGATGEASQEVFRTKLLTRTTPIDTTIYDSTATPLCTTTESGCSSLPCGTHGYEIAGGYIRSSVCTGPIRVHYRKLPTDENDFPLIPDNESYKQAIYWYVRSMMIGAGYQDPVFSYEVCDAKYTEFRNRAVNQISYPPTDELNAQIPSITRFLPDNYLSFFAL